MSDSIGGLRVHGTIGKPVGSECHAQSIGVQEPFRKQHVPAVVTGPQGGGWTSKAGYSGGSQGVDGMADHVTT